MTTYIELGVGAGGGGSEFYGDPVPNFASLPLTGQTGEVRLTLDTGVLYYWDGLAWNVAETEVATVGHTDTDSIDLSTPGSVLNASLNLSADVASAGFLKATTSIKSGVNKGLHVEIPIADTLTTGVITDTDWDTFNNKEPAITSSTNDTYYRGDKTFAQLNVDAITVLVGGAINGGNKLLGIDTATSAMSSAGANGVWSNASSLAVEGGTYLCFGVLKWTDNNAVLTGDIRYGISSTSDASNIGSYDYNQVACMFSDNNRDYIYNLPFVVLSELNDFTIYLNTQFQYSSGTPQHGGKIIAMRIR